MVKIIYSFNNYFKYKIKIFLKLFTFIRMNLNTKEIADTMGLSVRSVESRKYLLRKKIKTD
jgi:hypothetical protein